MQEENKDSSLRLKLHILEAWGSVEYREEDHQFLHRVGILSILCRFMSLSSMPSMFSRSSDMPLQSTSEVISLYPIYFIIC